MAFVLNRGILILWMMITPVLSAEEISVKDQGVFGELFDIAEEDMIEMLKGKLQKLKESGQLAAIETSLKKKAKEKIETPTPVQGLKPTDVERTFTHDPSLLIEADIKDPSGQVLAQKGQRLNPLTVHKPSQGLLFIDGEDEDQKQLGKRNADRFIVILVKGKPLEVEKELGIPVYFDQRGVLCQHYKIQQIPARIEVQEEVLIITEFKVTP